MKSSAAELLTVTQVNYLLNKSIEDSVPKLAFEGEIAQLTRVASGHMYLTIKDRDSQLSAVMWKSLNLALKFQPKQGDFVYCAGKPNVYHKSGKLQIILSKMEPGGEGLLRKKFLELRARLEKEGYFSEDRKRELPQMPKTIGVVTSATGAVIHDIMVKIKERANGVKVVLVDVRVQGPGSAEEIAAGIKLLNTRTDVEVIIVGRGGGSLEDLWAFNEEVVVKEIFKSRIPIVSGVGHEVDITLADLAADLRAPTPTAAAEMIVPNYQDLLDKVNKLAGELNKSIRWLNDRIQALDEITLRFNQQIKHMLNTAKLEFKNIKLKILGIRPDRVIEKYFFQIDSFEKSLRTSINRTLQTNSGVLNTLASRLNKNSPINRIATQKQNLVLMQSRLNNAWRRQSREMDYSLSKLAESLKANNPEQILSKGYSIVKSKDRVVSDASSLKQGDILDIQLYKGQVRSEVK